MVFDAEVKRIPKIAIECDGAAYHSSTEAYLNDVYRQKILESNGFVFHRIWSTNWWRSPQKEAKRLTDFIEETCKSKVSASASEKNSLKEAFTDIIVTKEASLVELKEEYQADIKEFVALDELPFEEEIKEKIIPPMQQELFQDSVVLKSIVEIKYINIGKNFKVQLVDERIKQFNINNDFQKIDYKSPLGNSLLGKCVGDAVQVGNLENYVEVLAIEINE